ncbi:unnamed protein product [Vitrella brassicaformis CCMP3155]|uniref:GUN4-like domain-containing protein n=2 Tax=Vitrella brassicaformis TaxID=1169539 RepID=A0A0G4FIT9_VITBC|nr:unnamed protein product [Vitrella brassicaformis CCMP3155]|eukprot:CEM13675.1 unnamed protein product [Vitrella brassicaformis CCMP3155]
MTGSTGMGVFVPVCLNAAIGIYLCAAFQQLPSPSLLSRRSPFSSTLSRLRTARFPSSVALSASSTVTDAPPSIAPSAIESSPLPDLEPSKTDAVVEVASIPEHLPSEAGKDYRPLACMLAKQDFKEADQFTRDMLIELAGPGAQMRKYVYFTEVRKIPVTDMATIERLWLHYSNGRFGYSVQKKVWKTCRADFQTFCSKVGWSKMEDGIERLRRWFGENEFMYDLDKAPRGHLPLTNTLRGTTLFKEVLNHPAWDSDVLQEKLF